MVCLSQHHPGAFCHQSDRTECCTKCTQSTKFHNCTFWQQRCIEEKTNFLLPLWITQAGAGSNSGFVVRVSQWRNSEKFQMSASCLGWHNVTLWPIVRRLNTLQTPPFDIHWSPLLQALALSSHDPGAGPGWVIHQEGSIIGQESPSVIHLQPGVESEGWAGKWE